MSKNLDKSFYLIKVDDITHCKFIENDKMLSIWVSANNLFVEVYKGNTEHSQVDNQKNMFIQLLTSNNGSILISDMNKFLFTKTDQLNRVNYFERLAAITDCFVFTN